METSVAIVQTRPETVIEDYARLLRLAGIGASEDPDDPLAICLDHDLRARGATLAAQSPPWQLEGVVTGLLRNGYSASGIKLAAPVAVRPDRDTAALWHSAMPEPGLAMLGRSAGMLDVSKPFLLLAALRTDYRLGLPGCLGTLMDHLTPAEVRHPARRRIGALHDFLLEAGEAAIIGGVVDASVCGVGPSVHSLQPTALHLLLAGRDPVAVDAVAAWLVGLDPLTLPLLTAAASAGWGCNDPSRIDIVGDVKGHILRCDDGPLVSWRRFPGKGRSVERFPFLDLIMRLPWAMLRTRRNRRRYAGTAWGRLQQHYARRGIRQALTEADYERCESTV